MRKEIAALTGGDFDDRSGPAGLQVCSATAGAAAATAAAAAGAAAAAAAVILSRAVHPCSVLTL